MANIVPPDYSTPIGQVRLMISDDDVAGDYAFSDEMIQTMLVVYRDNIYLASAALFDRIAMDTVLIYKVVRTDDLQVDGAKMAQFFRDRAAQLRQEAAEDDLVDAFQVVYPWGEYHAHPEAVPYSWAL